MINIVIFGTGSGCKKMLLKLDYKIVNIIAFVDNDKVKQGKIFNEKSIISPGELKKCEYNYVLICSEYYKEIINQLLDQGIDRKRILTWYYYPDDGELNKNINNKILNDISIPTSKYFINFKNSTNRKIEEIYMINKDNFNMLDKEYYNNNYSELLNDTKDCNPQLEYCEKVINNLIKNEKFNYKDEYKNLNVLDVGCGLGGFSEAFRKNGFSVLGIDYSSSAINEARKRYSQCKFQEMDATNPQLRKERFDIIFMRGLSITINTHNLYLIKDIMDKYYNYLNYGGIFIFSSSTNFSGIESGTETVNLTLEEIKKLSEIVKYKFVDILYLENSINKIKCFNEKNFFYLILQKES